jgi:hypothetical protein
MTAVVIHPLGGVGDGVAERVAVGEAEEDGVPVDVGEAVPVCAPVAVPVRVGDGVPVDWLEGVAGAEALTVDEGVAVVDAVEL